jgi:hypothetical protein
VIAYWIPSSSYDGRFRNRTQISDLATNFFMWGGIIIGTVGIVLGCVARGDLVFFQLSALSAQMEAHANPIL